MKFVDILGTASSNMFRSKLRTSLTIVAIFIGAFTLTLTNGLGSGISTYIDKQLGNLGAEDVLVVYAAGDSNGITSSEPKKYDPSRKTTSIETEGNRSVTVLSDSDIKKIANVEGIKSAAPYSSATIDYVAYASSDKFVASISPVLTGENRVLDAGKTVSNSPGLPQVMFPSNYLAPLGFKNADEAIGKTLKLGVTSGLGEQKEITATITAVEEKGLLGGTSVGGNDALIVALRKVQFSGLPPASASAFQVATARFDVNATEAEITKIKERLKTAGYTAQTIKDQIGTLKAVINGIVAVLNGFAIIALLAASFGIINTLLMSVQERTKEIGLMKAMGMGSGRIFLLFSLEATMLGFWGSILGSLVAIGVGSIINKVVLDTFLKDLVGLQLLNFPLTSVAVIVGIVMAIAFIAGTLPAIRAARQNPIDSLRYE